MNDLLHQTTFQMTRDSSLWSKLETYTLEPDEIHLWRVDLNVSQNDLDYFFCLLSDEEKNKAQHFRKLQIRDAFVARRGLLRILLGRYVRVEARDIRFAYNAFDKPSLATLSESYKLHFNVSHIHDVALIAISRSEVGIDIERIDFDYPCQTIAEEFFAPHEVSALRALPDLDRVDTFFRYWTAKEAVAKAIGTGLSVSLGAIGLEFFDKKSVGYANVLFPTWAKWHFRHLELHAKLLAALASRNPVQHVVYSDVLPWYPGLK